VFLDVNLKRLYHSFFRRTHLSLLLKWRLGLRELVARQRCLLTASWVLPEVTPVENFLSGWVLGLRSRFLLGRWRSGPSGLLEWVGDGNTCFGRGHMSHFVDGSSTVRTEAVVFSYLVPTISAVPIGHRPSSHIASLAASMLAGSDECRMKPGSRIFIQHHNI
jgi:hypothetical protein